MRLMALFVENPTIQSREKFTLFDDATLMFNSIHASLDPCTKLPADILYKTHETLPITSPTNIGLALLSIIAARELSIIKPGTAHDLINTMARYLGPNIFSDQLPVNWIDTRTAMPFRSLVKEKSRKLFYSSVDSAWLLAGLCGAAEAFPEITRLRQLAQAINLRKFYNPRTGLCAGERSLDGINSSWDYGVTTEARIIGYMGVALGQIPPEHLLRLWQSNGEIIKERYPEWFEVNPNTTPTWGGSMFEALMVSLIFNEISMAPHIFEESHHRHVAAHQAEADPITRGWGYSCASTPDEEGYMELGVKKMGLFRLGYELGLLNGSSTQRIITPHALYLALLGDKDIALEGIGFVNHEFGDLRGEFGPPDSINTHTRNASPELLVLDQSMGLLSIAEHLKPNCIRKYFKPLQDRITPLVSSWQFPRI